MPTRMEEAASKTMEAVKAVKAGVEGLHGVFKQLAEEHGQVTALLLRVKMSSDPEVRRATFPEIRSQLLAHEQGELREVYPAFAGHSELEGFAQDHQAEAHEMEEMLDQLNAMDCEDPSWKDKFDKLVEVVKHHTGQEENEYFPAAERVLGREESERLEGAYEQTKSALLRQPS